MIDIEALAREAGAKYELLGDSDEPTRSGWCFEAVSTRRMVDAFPSLAAYTNAVLEAAARCVETLPVESYMSLSNKAQTKSQRAAYAGALRALKVKP